MNLILEGGSPRRFRFGEEAIDAAVKVNVDTDTQWAYWEGILKFYKAKQGYLQGQIGNPDGQDKPNKSYYDPRKWLRCAEESMRDRVKAIASGQSKPTPEGGKAGQVDAPDVRPSGRLAELKATAQRLCSPGKGFLASDESAGPWLRAGHAEAKTIPDTAENRAAYRSMCYTTPGLSENISGVILHWETLFQKDAAGTDMVKLIADGGMLSGIKHDKAYDKKGMWGTRTGPLGHPETATRGLDDLQERAAHAYAQGARFAKWRNVLQLDPAQGLPSD